jgi:membrane protease YdiL (CAAX protease family)
MLKDTSVDQHSFGKSLFYHLAPGLLIGGVYYLLIPIVHRWGFPSILALVCAIPLALIPFELGVLLYQGKKRNNRISRQGIVMYRRPIPIWQYFLWAPILFGVIGIVFTVMKPVDNFLQTNLFSMIPLLENGLSGGYSRETLMITYGLIIIFVAFVGPLVEELYFRGFLLPRMNYAGKWALLLHCFLFALYHTWSPWFIITRTIGFLPIAYASKRGNLYLAIVLHIMCNMVDVTTGIIFIARMSNLGG